MYHVYSLLVKPKYSVNDVKKINQLCKMHIPGNFKHYCLTDDLEQFAGSDFCELINVKEYRLDTWWNKLLLFKQGICPKNEICLFFDLDSSIVNSLAPILSNYNGNRFDIPMLNKEFLEAGMPPPSPAKHIDLLQTSYYT